MGSELNRNNNITKENNININDSKLLISDIQKKIQILQTKLTEIENYNSKLTNQNKRFSEQTSRIQEDIKNIRIFVEKYNQNKNDLIIENKKLKDNEQYKTQKDEILSKIISLKKTKVECNNTLKQYKIKFPLNFQYSEDLKIDPPVDFNDEVQKQKNFKNKYLKYKMKYITLKK